MGTYVAMAITSVSSELPEIRLKREWRVRCEGSELYMSSSKQCLLVSLVFGTLIMFNYLFSNYSQELKNQLTRENYENTSKRRHIATLQKRWDTETL